jgi:cytochrome b561
MRMTDTTKGYGLISIALHWIVAAFIVFLFVSGQVVEALDKAPMAREVRMVHISIGALAACFIIGRLIWRVAHGAPEKIGGETLLNKLAVLVQWALIAVMVGSVFSGIVTVWSNGRDVALFGLPVLPTPMAKNEGLHHFMEEMHEVMANTMIALVLVHVAGAIKHALIDRDGVMARIISPVREA